MTTPLTLRFVRYDVDLSAMVCNAMDLLTLIQWRAACRSTYAQGVFALKRDLVIALGAFLMDPLEFLEVLTETQAVIGGILALAFVLRDRTLQPDVMDIYIADTHFNRMLERQREAGDIYAGRKTLESRFQ